MRKSKFIAVLLTVITVFSFALACGCGKKDDPPAKDPDSSVTTPTTPDPKPNPPNPENPDSGDTKPLQFNGITLKDAEFYYDGTSKSISVSGTLPDGAQVAYVNQTAINAGVYDVSATVTKNSYETLHLSATMTIRKATMSGIQFEGKTVEYDQKEHSIDPIGNIPAGSTVKVTYNGKEASGVIEVGEYNVSLTITNPNYNDYVASAKLVIRSTETALYSVYDNGKIFFQNALDGEKLYVYQNGVLSKVNNNVPLYLTANDGTIYYNSSSLLSNSIKAYNATTGAVNLVDAAGEYLVSDGKYLYYAVNNLVFNTDVNGIYKLSLTNQNAVPVRIVKDKAAYLTVANGTIYYSNKSDGDKLYSVSAAVQEKETGTLLYDQRCEYLITDGNDVYFNATRTAVGVGIASAITKYDVSATKFVKLTNDSGKYLTKQGNFIYYVNNDLLTSSLFGDGIYKVSALSTADSNESGIKILSCENNGYSSLSSDGQSLYYYKLNDKHFYRYDISSTVETDLMKNFVPVEESVTPSGYAFVTEYGNEIYYTDPRDGGCLYKYDKTNGKKIKVLQNSVSNVYFYNGYMYYSTYVSVQYALWRMDLKNNVSQKISTSRCDNLIFDGDYVYYIKVGSKYDDKIMRMNLDGSNPTEIFSSKNLWVKNLIKDGNRLYFTINPLAGKKYVYSYDLTSNQAENLELRSNLIAINGNLLYYYNIEDNSIDEYNLSTKTSTKLIYNVKVNDMKVINGKLYYSSYFGDTGCYEFDLSSNHSIKISDSCGHGFLSAYNGIYFIRTALTYQNDYPSHSNGDGKLCFYNGSLIKVL